MSLPLDEQTILVVEDDYYLATELQRMLTDAGASVVGPIPTVKTALKVVATTPLLQAAVIDVNLGGEFAFPLADKLAERGIPFAFSSGYRRRDLPQAYRNQPLLEKPFEAVHVIDTVRRLILHV